MAKSKEVKSIIRIPRYGASTGMKFNSNKVSDRVLDLVLLRLQIRYVATLLWDMPPILGDAIRDD